MQVVLGARPWGELVMHVLAQVPAPGSLPSSLYSPAYVKFVAAHTGPAADRDLAQSLTLLGTLLADHESLAAVQALAVRYADVGAAFAEADQDLRELDATSPLMRVERAAELLRATALLEAPSYACLPEPTVNTEALRTALEALHVVAPRLAHARIVPMRPLGPHGRLFGQEIWIGLPGGPDGTSLDAVALQAAHEASVAEVRACADDEGQVDAERAIEAVALVLLAARARQAGLADAHRRWYARWSGDTRWLSIDALDAAERDLLACCLRAEA